ncbi:sulfatase [Anaerocolumna cellulosilytica]|uniref:Sulfatase n=1 Tax=Anaerocolumna cellulosilytica TaxID=433286 RepID=A0A6S6R8N0_9FIRM|nr:LTA synthase family protein [Anaerocolumna cellulosilytica]MBB5197712.1 phosphoglycerol transferase MdoB-like AlkP superfamily enzyme [Anaerocolumna cellulosilytica]BCJ96467.1 sulfatase [Anaerocolumna cellulosilytica]
MKQLKTVLQSPYMILLFFTLKLMVYYHLISVNVKDIIFVVVSIVAMGLIFICFSRSRWKRKKGFFLIIYSLLSLLMFADSMYYNYYNQTVSIKQLWQAANVAAVPDSFVATLIPASFLLYLDIPFVYYYFKKLVKEENRGWSFKKEIKYLVAGLCGIFAFLVINPFGSVTIDKVNSVEFFTSHVNDIYNAIADSIVVEEVSADEVLDTVQEVAFQPKGTKYKGIGEGKNVILLQVEALQNFVIGAEYNGQVLTPNLNALIKQDTLYYDRYYTNIGKGNTADAEFSTLNSLYPVIDRECYTLYEQNTFNGLPWLLRDKGYNAFVIHGYKGEFWNREAAYPAQGFEDFYSMEDMEADDIIGLGISDKSMFKQTIDILKEKKQPFFSFIITLTSHHPFILEEEDASLQLKEEDIGTKFGSYLQTVRYADEALGQFITDLKTAGLYEDTVIALYGDHHGLNLNMDDNAVLMEKYLGRTYDYDEMLRVPMLIHVPGSGVTDTISTTGGQVDFLPTIANVMNLEISQPYILGQDLSNAKDGFVAFTAYLFEGSFIHNEVMFEISREGVFEGSRAWKIGTNEPIDASMLEDEYKKAITLKKTSEDILNQNLIQEYLNMDTIKSED